MTKNTMNRRDFSKRIGIALGTGALAAKTLSTDSATATLPKETAVRDGWKSFWKPVQPQRLDSRTRELADMALRGDHGRSMVDARDTIPWNRVNMNRLSRDLRYGQAILQVARHAPLRLLDGEYLAGSATLREGPAHLAPLMELHSTSHTTLGFEKVMHEGYAALAKRVEKRLEDPALNTQEKDFLMAMAQCLEAAAIWKKRYQEEIARRVDNCTGAIRERYLEMQKNLERVPENPPENFREAVQGLWFMYSFQRLMGTWSGIGRIDAMLGPYLERDLASGAITMDEAREYIAHFWIKGCEWVGAFDHRGSGDAQHYQNIILAGIDEVGKEVTNTVTYLVLDVVEELHISDFPIAVRLNRRSPKKLLRRMAEVQRHGGGIVAAYNEEVVIEGLVRYGYEEKEARTFTNDGCWEVLIPGRTSFAYMPFDGLVLLHRALGLDKPGEAAPNYEDFEEFYGAYLTQLQGQIDAFNQAADQAWKDPNHPAPLVSLFVEDCIEKARSYQNGGARYRVLAPHMGRMANVANSLAVIKKLVYEEKFISLPELVETLRKDWNGQDPLRALIQKRFRFYGNNDANSDAMMERVFNSYSEMVGEVPEREGVLRPCGISTFGREIEWSHHPDTRHATADGHRSGSVLATNFSPSPGTDLEGPTAVLQSYCKMDFTKTPNGATVELKVHPQTVSGENGLEALMALMRSMVRMGGFFMHVDVVDTAMLIDAQRHPEKYPNLSVRLSGWSARFATLDGNWQNMVIQRTQQYV